MRYLFLLCSLSYASEDYTVDPCVQAVEGECPTDEEALEQLRDKNDECYFDEASLEIHMGGQCCYDVVISKCGGGCGS